MRGRYSEYAAPPVYVYPATGRPQIRFSRTELIQLLIAVLALSAAFTILYIRGSPSFFASNPGFFLLLVFPASLLAVGTGVGLHEVMHKIVAQRYGHWAEFRYNPTGLLFAFVMAAAIGFLYGAPGATWISGAVDSRQNGRISAAGPLSNIAIASVLIAALFLVPSARSPANIWGLYLGTAASVNAFLGAFNLLPIMPLDGAKVWAWNKVVYGVLAAVAIGLLVLSFY